ncbi:MAG TPA: iron-containing alcohol dehydrogenase, partial [Elusimicrobiales bacterium]|nr:iron-containing alcohol dehydrogenase [Elusimicrobiales bacterium]
MENFIYSNPTKIIFGKNTVSRIGKEALKFGKKALIVYGKGSIKKNGVYDTVTDSLRKNGVDFAEHSGVKPNPVLSHVKEGIELFKKEKCDMIIAVGGGSVIDESKAVSCGVFYEGDVWDFFIEKAEIQKAVPILVVLTLPATGSEANSGAVVTNEKTLQKYSIHSYHLFPKVSILDPSTTFSLPIEQTAYGAVDAILHVSEGFFTTKDTDCVITDNYIYGVIKTLINSTERIMKDPKDYNARASFMWSATLALNGQQALGYKGIEFVNHVIEHSLSAIYDIPHGLGLGVVFPGFLKYLISKGEYERILEFGENILGIKNDSRKETALKTVN